ncbi:MAG: leucine-rich repeat domain-containing protein, partial [Saprospiraceae bacterium]
MRKTMQSHPSFRSLFMPFCFFVLFAVALLMPSAGRGQCDPLSDSLELVAFYNATGGPGWITKTNWLVPGQPISTWHGIEVNAQGCVTCIHLHRQNNNDCSYGGGIGNGLTGSLPNLNLPYLESLFLSNNQLSGPIPDLNQCSNLEWLWLGNNQLSGNIPNFNLPNLQYLGLNPNNLTGNIPDFGQCPNLMSLNLSDNDLSGNIPNFNLPSLTALILGGNQLDGSIPDFLSLSSLVTLNLSNNQLSGCIPSELQGRCQTISGDISGNPGLSTQSWNLFCYTQQGMCCTHPDKPALIALYESTNGNNWGASYTWDTTSCDICSWAGVICDGLQRVTSLKIYSPINMTGVIPPEIDGLTELDTLVLFGNLSGPIPVEIGNLYDLQKLSLASNEFFSPLPSEIGNLSQLEVLSCANNKINGNLPPELGNLSNLWHLNLANNLLSGTIPDEYQNLLLLEVLGLQGNDIFGTLPEWIGNLSQLTAIALQENLLIGEIPASWGGLTTLTGWA